jgi:hypothetical protein
MNGKRPRLLVPVAALIAATALFIPPSSMAQQANPDAGFVAPKPKQQKVEEESTEKPAPYDINGVVAQAFKMKKPLQLINPLAPAKDGDGSENISWDPDHPEKPKGIIILGIQW